VHSHRTFSCEVQHICGCCKWLLGPVNSDHTFQIFTHMIFIIPSQQKNPNYGYVFVKQMSTIHQPVNSYGQNYTCGKYEYLTFNCVRDEQFYTTLVAYLKVGIYFSDVFLRQERHFSEKGTKYVNSK
jgi:hypothetical protein